MKLVVGFLDARDFRNARPAPSGPEVYQHHLALHLGQIDLGTVSSGKLDLQGFANCLVLGWRRFLSGDFLNDLAEDSQTGSACGVVVAATRKREVASAVTHLAIGSFKDLGHLFFRVRRQIDLGHFGKARDL